MFFAKQKSYPTGSIVQHRDHYIYVKTRDREWQSQHRWIAELKGDATGKSGELGEGEKVYHVNGKKDDNRPQNLVRIQFDTTKYYLKPLKQSRVLHIPGAQKDERRALTDAVLGLAKQRERARAAGAA